MKAPLNPIAIADIARASFELARARLILSRFDIADALRSVVSGKRTGKSERAVIERVGLAIGRAAWRLPFRTDCLVQAMAAQHWLAKYGIASEIRIGARKVASAEFHAWLVAGEIVVVGGTESETYALLTPERDCV